ncbi:MAG TPA: transglycosylase SLT domain-containing protein [Longimicrobiales bacterium]|nr:transglycosylase SLT domain-containing protein [Longimicrobiales bacterium]
MKRTARLAVALTLCTLVPRAAVVGSTGASDPDPVGGPATSLDSARDELRVGRAWHAARILRAQGAATSSDPTLVLLMARAESGWKSWGSVEALLDGRAWLGEDEGGQGLLLLGRAQEELAHWQAATEAYQAYLAGPGSADAGRPPVLVRLARVALHAGNGAVALAALDEIPTGADPLGSWAALELAGSAQEAGDTALVVALLSRVRDPRALDAGWRVLPRARLAAGDSAGAEAAYLAVARAGEGSRRAEAGTEAGRLALARRDSAEARPLLEAGLAAGSLRSRGRAAEGLLSFTDTDLTLTLAMADVLDRLGDGARALRAYDRAVRTTRAEGGNLSEAARLARARLMSTVRDRQAEALEEFRDIRATTRNSRIGARNLDAWARMRSRQGRAGDVATLHGWLVAEHPASPEAAEVMWERGSAAESRGDLAEALRAYEVLGASAPELSRGGQARMRTGQIHFGEGRLDEAARVFEGYLADLPQGGRRAEAGYWAARSRLQLADTASARRLTDALRGEEAVSYYAVMSADLMGETYDLDLPEGGATQEPAWLSAGLTRLDLLQEAGLADGADAVEEDLVAQARGTRAVMLGLAEALIERGRTVTGINLGWEVRREGAPWDRTLLKVVYPFPYRELVTREAREWGVDPVMFAALIRQESAFKADIRSGAGAVGLMQVMPPTGRELARVHGPDGFQEVNLETPEVNLHLGAAFFIDMSRRYDNDLPLVLSAYNAGPTRATRWRRYPEASDPLRFTERIPFDETRGYVKNVRRNMGVYRVLYGKD